MEKSGSGTSNPDSTCVRGYFIRVYRETEPICQWVKKYGVISISGFTKKPSQFTKWYRNTGLFRDTTQANN